MEWFNSLKTLCKECHMVIVENNSTDNTRKFCNIWKKMDPNYVHIVCNSLECNGD